jgi:hypothetical protein
MKINDLIKGFKVYGARVKIKLPGYTTVVSDITIFARDQLMARSLLKQQYGDKSVISVIREIRP